MLYADLTKCTALHLYQLYSPWEVYALWVVILRNVNCIFVYHIWKKNQENLPTDYWNIVPKSDWQNCTFITREIVLYIELAQRNKYVEFVYVLNSTYYATKSPWRNKLNNLKQKIANIFLPLLNSTNRFKNAKITDIYNTVY